jgi:hypothetical protein
MGVSGPVRRPRVPASGLKGLCTLFEMLSDQRGKLVVALGIELDQRSPSCDP